MKLKRHREDVKDLKLMQDNYIQAIAKRYQNIILVTEETLDDWYVLTRARQRVLKDAGKI